MTQKKAKKPSTAELIQQLVAKVAELRGRVEKLEARASHSVTVYREADPPQPPLRWWGWFGE